MGFQNRKLIITLVVLIGVISIFGTLIMVTRQPAKEPVNEDISSDLSSFISSLEESASEQSSDIVEVSSEPLPIKKQLQVTYPKKDITIYKDSVVIKGSGDPALPVFINDKQIEQSNDGIFSHKVTLSIGNNYFTVKQGEDEYKCVVRYRKTVILSVNPTDDLTLDGGSKLTVSVRALAKSTVTAVFNGETITLTEKLLDNQDEYADYFGSFTMPVNYDKNKNYGKISFNATSYAGKGKASSGVITVRKTERPVDNDYVMPTGKNYIDVGHTYIAEVVCRSAETMNVDDDIDYSRPTNNYLPKGTVDYCSATEDIKYVNGEKLLFRTLRYGKQLYLKTSSSEENIKVYEGSLPATNKVSVDEFTSDGRHTKLRLNVDWKAPFYFDILPQSYRNDGNKNLDYTFSEPTYSYIDITFCYAEQLLGNIDLTDNNIFSRYEIIKNESDYTLRLHLKNKGKFYGWSAEYDEEGKLCFNFLNPVVLKTAENDFGYSLDGVKILVDAGHGGQSIGAEGFHAENTEAALNLILAKKLEDRLKALGATVIMTRSDDSDVSSESRMDILRDSKPDYAISIHRNAFSSQNPRAFNSYHFTPFSSDAAKMIYSETEKQSLYQVSRWSGVKFHYFFLARSTECPSVLTENGYITNPDEYNDMIKDEFNDKCADALVNGIFAYFKSIQL